MLVFLILAIANLVKTDHICDIELLKIELQEDMDDNGILDCLREISPSSIKEESDREINARLSAQWDSDCSFETSNENLNKVKQFYEISSYYDSLGNKQDKDNDDQADICELIRAAYGDGKFGYYKDLKKVDKNFLAFLDCPGKGDITQPCAYNESNFWEQGLWTIVYQPVGIKIKNKQYADSQNKEPKYLPHFKLQGQITDADLQTKKEKDKENIQKLRVFQSEQTNMVKAINSQQNLDQQKSTQSIIISSKFQSLGSAYNLKLNFLDDYNFFIFTSITANFEKKSKDDPYLMCRNQIIRQSQTADQEGNKIPIVKNFPFTLTDYQEGTSYFNLQSFSRKYVQTDEASYDVQCYSNTNIKLNKVKAQIFTWGLYLDAKLAQQTKIAYLQPLQENTDFQDFANQDLINLYIDVDKYRKLKFGDDDSQYIHNDKGKTNEAKKQLLLVTYEVSGQFTGKLEVKAYSQSKDKQYISDYMKTLWNDPIKEEFGNTANSQGQSEKKKIDFKQSYSMKQQKLYGSVFGFGIAELDPKGIFKLGLQYKFTPSKNLINDFPLDQRSKELDDLATKEYVSKQKLLKTPDDKHFATITYNMILLPYLNLKQKKVIEVKLDEKDIPFEIDDDHSILGKEPIILKLDKNLNNKFTNFEFNAYHALISYHISFECDSNSPQIEFYLTQWNEITLKYEEIQGSRVVSEEPDNSPQIQILQANTQNVKTIRTASVLTYAKFTIDDNLNDYLDSKEKTIEIYVMARLVNIDKIKKSTITLKKKNKEDPIENQTFSRLEVNLFASIDDITKNKYDT